MYITYVIAAYVEFTLTSNIAARKSIIFNAYVTVLLLAVVCRRTIVALLVAKIYYKIQ